MNSFISKIIVCIAAFLLSTHFLCFSQSPENGKMDGIAYTVAGEGPLLVFIHGSNLDRRMWASQVEALSPNFKILTYDLRGLGASEIPLEPYSNATDLVRLVENIGESKATLIGLSAGVQVALDVATEWPDMVDKLILVSPSLNGFKPTQQPPYISDLITALQKGDYDQANEVLLASSIMSVPSDSKKLVREMVVSSNQWKLAYELMEQNPEPIIKNLDRIGIPTLILLGENDVQAVTELGEFLLDEMPNADLEVIPDGRHLLNLSHPKEFNTALQNFVEPQQ